VKGTSGERSGGSSGAEVALSAGVLALGAGAAAVTATLPAEGGYAGIGPNFMPGLVSAGLVAIGAWLLYEALTGGWRSRGAEKERFQRAPFFWVSAGLFAHVALIGWAGFVIAGAALFVFVARGFGSTRFLRDLAIGVALALAIFVFFTEVLNVNLPAGWMPFKL
jgi:putative tricarboxylic transport membrane protein